MQALSAQVVLAHPPVSLAPVKGPRQESIQMVGYLIFEVQRVTFHFSALTFYWELFSDLTTNIFNFLRIFFFCL